MASSNRNQELKSLSYEFFILAITILAIVNIFIIWFTPSKAMNQVLVIVNFSLSILLMADFLYRLFTSPSKLGYFFKGFGWLDLLGSLPFTGPQLFRLFRAIRIIRLLVDYGASSIGKDIRRDRAASSLAMVSFLVILVLQFGSYLIIGIESPSSLANINTPLDAIWWVFVTIATVGYGDKFPVTSSGRIIGTLVIIIGVVLFSVLTGFIASRFYSPLPEGEKESITTIQTDLDQIHTLLEAQDATLSKLEKQLSRIEDQINRD
jgi:voltage-gated potassium channel